MGDLEEALVPSAERKPDWVWQLGVCIPPLRIHAIESDE